MTIPRVPFTSAPAAATMQHLLPSGARARPTSAATSGRRSAPCSSSRTARTPCRRRSPPTTPARCPRAAPARTLSAVTAYARRACSCSRPARTTSSRRRRPAQAWSDAELHASMIRHFSRWRDLPQWAVWLFHARLHDIGSEPLRDHVRPAGKAAAGLRRLLPGDRRHDRRRAAAPALHVHPRAWALLQPAPLVAEVARDPAATEPARVAVLDELPVALPRGPATFWSAFPFRFDAQELVHIRHAFLKDVIMGGTRSALERRSRISRAGASRSRTGRASGSSWLRRRASPSAPR